MNLGDIKVAVKRQFGDESSVQVTDADILRWANQGIIDIVMQNDGLLQAVSVTDLIGDQTQYTPPTDMLGMRGVSAYITSDVAYRNLKGLNLQDFNAYLDGWDGNYYSNSAYPAVYMFYNNVINIFPRPSETITDGLKIYYNRYPTKLVLDTDTIPLPETYHNAVQDFCLQQAYEMDENWEGSGNKAAQVQSSINLLKDRQEWQTQDTYPVINVCVEDM